MTIGSGLGAQLGIAPEGATFGVFVPPTRFVEFESESILWNPSRSVGKGLYNGGLVSRASARATTSATVAGGMVTPVYSKGMGYWLGLIFGTLGITPAVQGATAAYLQTHPLSNNAGQSASIQVGRPTMDGTSHAYNYTGMKVTKAVFDAKVNEPLRLTLTFDGKDVQETSPLVTAVYQAANPAFFWHQGIFKMGALGAETVVEGVREFQLTVDRPQKVDNFYLDGTGRKGQQVMNDYVKVTGSLQTDFLSKAAFVDVFAADTPQSIIVPFTGPVIAGAFASSFSLSMPHCRFDNDGPIVNGPDIVQPKMAFSALFDDVDVPLTATYCSTDVTL